jgi:HEAT repeat protein
VVGVVAGLVASRENEPNYKGKPLSQWADAYMVTDGDGDAAAALRAIGVKGVPAVLRWVSYQPSAARIKLDTEAEKLPPFLQWMSLDEPRKRRESAGITLMGLGPEARRLAVPELGRLMRQGNKAQAWSAMKALAHLGDDGLPTLLATYAHPQFTNHAMLPSALFPLVKLGTNGVTVVHLLVDCLTNKNRMVRSVAAGDLGNLAIEPDLCVPALIRGLADQTPDVRGWSATALGKFKKAAAPAVPALLSTLSDADTGVRRVAAEALAKIAPEELEKYKEAHKTPTDE